MGDSSEDTINIQLGDILNIIAPDNTNLNDKPLYIEYIDTDKIILISDKDPLKKIILQLNRDGEFNDPSIEGIEILSRAEFPGYAKQNNLIPGTWINIYFGGDIPFIIIGRITDLEQDSIEITTFPDNDVIYIDFAYKGIPEDLDIQKIIIRNSPIEKTGVDIIDPLAEGSAVGSAVDDQEYDHEEKLKTIYIDADQINFGPDLEDIIQTIDVPESEKRYSIDKQIADLLDDLLSYIPTYKRTPEIENQIHLMIERFKQLRTIYSNFDENGNPNIPDPKTESYKPILQSILNYDKQFSWLLPVSQNKKNIYDLQSDILDNIDVDAINPLDIGPILSQQEDINKMYRESAFSADENKYTYLFRLLNRYYTPFIDPNNTENKLHSQRVNTNILSIVNNLDNFYSLVASNAECCVERKKFYFDTYTKGLNYIKDKKLSKLTPNDNITTRSFITLPLSTLLYSAINLPTTNILRKSDLNMVNLNYWEIFKKNKNVNSTLILEDFDEIQYTEDSFLNGITSIILSETLYDSDDAFKKYVNSFIPKTIVLLDLLKNNIENKYSVYSVVKFLELFMIYYEDIIYEQYEILVDYVENEISKYKTKYLQDSKKYNKLYPSSKPAKINNALFQIINSNDEIYKILVDSYGINNTDMYSETELLKIILNTDSGNLFFSAFIKLDFDLQTSNLVDNFINSYEEFIADRNTLQNTCKILVKKYNNIVNLEADNNKEILVDKELDKSTDGKNIENGEYAILVLPIIIGQTPKAEYYVRENNVWVRDNNLDENVVIKDNKLFCNLQDQCISGKASDCNSLSTGQYKLDEETLKIILTEFDSTFGAKEGRILDEINKTILENVERIKYLKKIEVLNFLKYDKLKREIGFTIDPDELENIGLPVSRYENLRDIILAQQDFRKKQFDIQRFVVQFTRQPYPDEDQFWLYAKNTGTKLLPLFLSYLANIYLANGDYLYELDVVAARQGTISDNGNKWVDKHSGYIIKDIDFDTEEGFTEEGFKLKTREVLEEDLGNAILTGTSTKQNFPETPETKKIRNIITTITREIGVDISHLLDFITRNILTIYQSIKPDKKTYEEKRELAIKAGRKKVPTYEDSINISYATLTLVFLLVAIQISIPKIVSRKTFPGCKAALNGYPADGSDRTALTYIACIAFKLSKGGEAPWTSLLKIKEAGIIKHMEQFINDYVLSNPEIKERFLEKRVYEKQYTTGELLVDLDVNKLPNFLPPLKSFKLKQLETLSPSFIKRLFEYLRTGSYLQQQDILVIKSKIFYFSLSIQEKIQKILDKIPPVLTNFTGQPFLENACCDELSTKTLQYFTSRDKGIIYDNTYVTETSNLLYYLRDLATAPFLFDPEDTKRRYPSLLPGFSKQTIYLAFIYYCTTKQLIKDDALNNICINNTDDTSIDEGIEAKIQRIEAEGIYYDNIAFQKLMDVINLRNIVNINLFPFIPNQVELLRHNLDDIDMASSQYIPPEFVKLFLGILDTYSIGITKNTPEMREFKDYLYEYNKGAIIRIETFVKNNTDLKPQKLKEFLDCLRVINPKDNRYELFIGKFTESTNTDFINPTDETLYKTIYFIKNSISNILYTFPQIILNQVNYSDINIPKHWNISARHSKDIKDIVNRYYESLELFYGDEDITGILRDIQIISKTIDNLSKNTPFYAYKGQDNNEIYSVFDRRLTHFLYSFYFLSILDNYISLIDKIGILLNPQLTAIIEQDEDAAQDAEATTGTDAAAQAEASLELQQQTQHDITSTGINVIDKKLLSRKITKYIVTIMKIICNNKSNLNYNSKSIDNAVLKSKEKEKEIITDHLKGLTDEEREIENLFKNTKLERWSKGLQKGITQYVQKTYDEEREDLEQQAIKEKTLGVNSDVTDRNRNIYTLDLDKDSILSSEIDSEVYNLVNYPNEGGDDDEGVDDVERDYDDDNDPDGGDDYGYIVYEGFESAD